MLYHQSVMTREVLEYLNVKSDGIYVDATFGGGGHTRAILEKLVNGKCIVFDQDEDAQKNIIHDERIIFIPQNFRYLQFYLFFYKFYSVDGVLADLGLSSYQVDNPSRGFTYLDPNAPLDMRMSKKISLTASMILNNYPKERLKRIFYEYGEVSFASKLVTLIEQYRINKKFEIVSDLTKLIDRCVIYPRRVNAYARVFQALRIEINDEINALKDLLNQSCAVLKPGGRLVVISYHSIEDRIVKHFLKTGQTEKLSNAVNTDKIKPCFIMLTKKVVVPSEHEKAINSRCRSARLRAGEKI